MDILVVKFHLKKIWVFGCSLFFSVKAIESFFYICASPLLALVQFQFVQFSNARSECTDLYRNMIKLNF